MFIDLLKKLVESLMAPPIVFLKFQQNITKASLFPIRPLGLKTLGNILSVSNDTIFLLNSKTTRRRKAIPSNL